MAKQDINLGTPPGGSDGDTSRTAFLKTKQNFDELYTRAQGMLLKDISGGAGTVSVSEAEALNGIIDLTGAISDNRDVLFPAAPTMAWIVRNSTTGTGTVTLRTAGGAGLVVAQGQSSIIFCDGNSLIDPTLSAAASVPGRLIGVQVFTSSGTYTATPGTKSVIVEVQAAGGAGGSTSADPNGTYVNGGGGGGAGGYAKGRLTSGFNGATVVVGAAGNPAPGGPGGAGGTSSFAGISATGGSGGSAGVAGTNVVAQGGAGGVGSGGSLLTASGNAGTNALSFGGQVYATGLGGASMFGGGGNCGVNGDGSSGGGYGAGGGGVVTGATAARWGGSGGQGVVIVWEYS